MDGAWRSPQLVQSGGLLQLGNCENYFARVPIGLRGRPALAALQQWG
jgi:hypothetical protein